MTKSNEYFEANSLADLAAQLPADIAALVLETPPGEELMRIYASGRRRCVVFLAPISALSPVVASLTSATPQPPDQP